MKNDVEFTVRLNPDLLNKLAYVAEKEGRTLNSHFVLMARNNIAYYEKTHEKIPSKPEAK